MATLENRITALEQKAPPPAPALLFSVYDSVPAGWSFVTDEGAARVMRKPREGDEALQSRAVAAATAARPGIQPVLFEVADHE